MLIRVNVLSNLQQFNLTFIFFLLIINTYDIIYIPETSHPNFISFSQKNDGPKKRIKNPKTAIIKFITEIITILLVDITSRKVNR
jgi:hypothetical protein